MKVLGIVPGTNELRCAVVDGTSEVPSLNKSVKVNRFNVDPSDGLSLQALFRLLSTWLTELQVDRIRILQPGNSQFGGPSPARLKIEAILQLVGAELTIDTALIAPQTLRAREKKFCEKTGGRAESVLNDGSDFSPKSWRDAVLVAWIGLE